ncbi:MAG: S8 family serine peptidase [Candidatus Thermoplasmatota archaeon]
MDGEPTEDPPQPSVRRVVVTGLTAVLLILAAVTGFWFATGTGPFSTIEPSWWALEMTEVTGLHARELDGTGVTVCIVDTGVDVDHPELRHVDLVGWRDFVNGRTEPYDDEGHGTAMAGIIFSRGRIPGVAPAAALIAVKAIGPTGSGVDTDLANAITFCVDPDADGDLRDGADVISISLGGRPHPLGLGSAAAVGEAMDAGVIVVAAAGNDGRDDDGDVQSPASVDRVLAVGAVDRQGVIAPFSSRGNNVPGVRGDPNKKPEVVAPGLEIATILPGGSYGYLPGTSPAAALVAGIVALLLDEHPEYRHQATWLPLLKDAIMHGACDCTGTDVPHDPLYGYGIVRGLATNALL